MSVSNDYIFSSYSDKNLQYYSAALVEYVRYGKPLHTSGLRTWLETMVIQDHHKFAGWLIKQDSYVQDAWLRLARSGTSSPWLRPLMDELSMEVEA